MIIKKVPVFLGLYVEMCGSNFKSVVMSRLIVLNILRSTCLALLRPSVTIVVLLRDEGILVHGY